MRAKVASLAEIVSLPLELAKLWYGRFRPEEIGLFLELCAFHTGTPTGIHVQDPPAPTNPIELLIANTLSEEDRVRSRLTEYDRQLRTGGGSR
jgi:hypothetical protein